MILCYGDSITKGVPGVSYLKFIDKKWKLRNCGLGGDTVTGLSNRITLKLKNHKCNDYIIQIGTNDILLPHLLQHSEQWQKRIEALIEGGRIPCENESEFVERYTNLIRMLKEHEKNFMVVNIPCIGEDLNSPLNAKVDAYNKALKSVTDKYKVTHIDFNGWQTKVLAGEKSQGVFFISKNPLNMIIDSVVTSVLPVSDYLSRRRGLHLTVDGCHLNSMGAKGLAGQVQEKLEGYRLAGSQKKVHGEG